MSHLTRIISIALTVMSIFAFSISTSLASGGAGCNTTDYPGFRVLVDSCLQDGEVATSGGTYAIRIASGESFTLEGGSLQWRFDRGWQGTNDGYHLKVNLTSFTNYSGELTSGEENWSSAWPNTAIDEEARKIIPITMLTLDRNWDWAIFEVSETPATSATNLNTMLANVADVAITGDQSVADGNSPLTTGTTYAIIAGRSFVVSYNSTNYTVRFQRGWSNSFDIPVEVLHNGEFTTAYPGWAENRAAHEPVILAHEVMPDGTIIIVFEIIDLG
jgi:hypothetical protein